jgi:Lrp/AsnC family transcriptional regulator for asnA, asnC and gidA
LSVELDDIDKGLLNFLKENSRKTFVDIGKSIGISDSTVYNRVKRLSEIGLIKKFTIEIDESLLKEKTKGFMQINVKPGEISEVAKNIVKVKGVLELHEVHGATDLFLKIEAESLEALRFIILKIREIPDIIQTEFFPIFKSWNEKKWALV